MNYVPLLKNRRYSKHEAFELYLLYVEESDVEVLNELWLYAIPLIGMLLKKEFRRLDGSLLEEFDAACALELRNVLSRKMPPINAAESFNSYIYKVVFSHTCRLLEREVREFQPKPELPFFWPSLVVSGNTVLGAVFAKHLPDDVLRHAEGYIRFQGTERRACVFLLDRLLQGHNSFHGALRVKYGMSDERIPFFVDYAQGLLRRVLYEIREL